MFYFLLFNFFVIVSSSRQSKKNDVTSILDRILIHEKYDKRLRPNYEDGPVIVKVGFWVLSIDSINVVDMDYSLDIFLRQSWKDRRMKHELNKTMFLSNTVMDLIWMPDSYFVNAKQGSFHKVTKDNMMIMIDPEGLVQYNARVTIRLSCPMDLRDFPMDTQHCPLTIESYGYSTEHIVFEWEISSDDGMGFVPDNLKMLPQYTLSKVKLSTLHNRYVVGNWSGIKAAFTFERLYSYFVIHVYGPCSLIVLISWIAFLLPREQAPARITLGVTSVLTVVTVLNMLNNSMPKVNYVKTIDKYLIGCFLFVFATLVEYSLVLWFSRRSKKYKQKKEEWKKQHSKATDREECEEMNCKQKNKTKDDKILSTQVMMMTESDEKEAFIRRGVESPSIKEQVYLKSSIHKPSTPFPCNKIKEILYSESFVSAIDGYALAFFPMSFITFNAIYWLSILSPTDVFGS